MRPLGETIALGCALSVALAVTLTAREAILSRSSADTFAPRIDQLFAPWDKSDSPGASVAVSRNGVVLYERAFGMANLELKVPNTPVSVFQVASVSKQFTAMCIMLLAERGRISLDDEVRKHVAEFPDYGMPLTIRHLLNHTSGLRDVYLLHQALAAPSEDNGDWNDILVSRLVAQRGLNSPPGTEFHYNNGGYVLLAKIVKRVSGQTLQEFAESNIFNPLGMTHTRFDDDPQMLVPNRVGSYARDGDKWRRAREEVTRPGAVGNTGLLSTAGDLLRWEHNFDGARVGSSALLRAMEQPATLNNGAVLPYGLGLWVTADRGLKTVHHGGGAPGYSAQTIRYPEKSLVIVVIANSGRFDAVGLARRIAEICLPGEFPDSPQAGEADSAASVTLPVEQLEAKAGLYFESEAGKYVRLFVRNHQLQWSRGTGTRGGLDMKALAENRFVIPGMFPLHFEFSAPVDGRAAEFRTSSALQVTESYHRVDPFLPSHAQLQEYAGSYANLDLEVIYAITARPSGLLVRIPGRERGFELEPCGRDLFQTPGGEAFKFLRNTQGAIINFVFSSTGVRKLTFERVKG